MVGTREMAQRVECYVIHSILIHGIPHGFQSLPGVIPELIQSKSKPPKNHWIWPKTTKKNPKHMNSEHLSFPIGISKHKNKPTNK